MLVAIAQAGWLAFVSIFDYYRVGVSQSPSDNIPLTSFSPDVPPSLTEYVSLSRREIWKRSVVYETKSATVVDELGSLAFLGIVMEDQQERAFLLNRITGVSSLYERGDQVGDLRLEKISADRLTFTHGNETLELAR